MSQHGADARVYRIGQIVGDTVNGVWNEGEMYPAIIRGGGAMGVMPLLPEQGERWLPVDVCARAVVEIEGLLPSSSSCSGEGDGGGDGGGDDAHGNGEVDGQTGRRIVYNILSPHSFSWSRDLFPALSELGLDFESVTFEVWLDRLRSLASAPSRGEHYSSATDPERNPALKLIDFFEENFSGKGDGGGVRFATEAAKAASPSLRNSEDVIRSGLLAKMVGVWMEKWKREEEGGDVGGANGEGRVE